MANEEYILKYFQKPGHYDISEEEWRKELLHALIYGCDWIEVMVDRGYGAALATAVSDMAQRLEGGNNDAGDPILHGAET